MSTALGAGIGSAFGIMMIGCYLIFLYTRRTKLKDKRESAISSHESENVHVDGSPMELRDTQRPHELDSNGKNELPGTGARIVPVL